jgi:hypothetical protein
VYRVRGAIIGRNFTPISKYLSTVKNRRKWVTVFRRVGAKGLTVFLASSWGCVNRLGRSYVTQGDRKILDLPPLPHPSPPATVVQWRPRRVPGFSRLHLSRAGIISYWPERAAHSQSEWRRPVPLRELNRQGSKYGTHNHGFFLLIQGFLIEIYTL